MAKEKRVRRQFSPEFKAEAVRLVLEMGKRVSEVARDLDIHESVVGAWVKQAKINQGKGPPGALTSSEKEELARLRKENRVLKTERDILRKAAAFFAKENV
jgi:transposase